MSRRRKAKEHENSERWLLTYADLITLLMIFFVVMYAMSKIDDVKFLQLQKSLALAMHRDNQIPINLGTSSLILAQNPTDQSQHNNSHQTDAQANQLDKLYKQINDYIITHQLTDNVKIANEQRGVQITLRDVVLFDTGKADIKPAAQKLLAGMVPIFGQLSNPIIVEGYTDNQPITTAEFPSNWELSSARAIGVVHFLASKGIEPDRLSGVGYGQYHPVEPNDTEAHRQANRRINIVILRNTATAGQT